MKKFNNSKNISNKKEENNCYYISYGMCGCKGTKFDNQKCVGQAECENYISESKYFEESMMGKDLSKLIKREEAVSTPEKHYDLSLGKSKKALKREAKIEAEKNNSGSGFSLVDDPRFKDLFQKK